MTPKSQTRLGAGIIAAVFLLVTLFLVKALVLAFFITPLWDIPDETAHFGDQGSRGDSMLYSAKLSIFPLEIPNFFNNFAFILPRNLMENFSDSIATLSVDQLPSTFRYPFYMELAFPLGVP